MTGKGEEQMHASGANRTVDPQRYLAVVERLEEIDRLKAQVNKRKSLLIFGPEAVGKTRLLESFLKTQPLALHVPQVQSPRDLLLRLVENLRRLQLPELTLPTDSTSLSTGSLKGTVQRALDQFPFILALDHLSGPSRVVTGLIKDLNYYDRTPVVLVARSPHMEDIGALQPMCAGRAERLELKEFAPPVALEFAWDQAGKTGLEASNLHDVLRSLVAWSNGNPGAIIQMVRMALLPRYRVDGQIKAHVLYLDHRMGRRE
jgi:hypothetical protein